MKRCLFVLGSLACAAGLTPAQTQAPYPPFTAEQARLGKQLIATSLEIRKGITNNSLPAEPYKIIGNLYFVGDLNGEVYLLTSPQGHILMGTGDADSVGNIQKNIESLGFKLTDIKAIVVNHNHGDQSGGAASMTEKTGAPLMAAFGEIPYIEHGMFNPPAIPPPPAPAAADGTAPRGRNLKCFTMNTYAKRADNPCRMNTSRIIGLKVQWNEHLQKNGGEAVLLLPKPGENPSVHFRESDRP